MLHLLLLDLIREVGQRGIHSVVFVMALVAETTEPALLTVLLVDLLREMRERHMDGLTLQLLLHLLLVNLLREVGERRVNAMIALLQTLLQTELWVAQEALLTILLMDLLGEIGERRVNGLVQQLLLHLLLVNLLGEIGERGLHAMMMLLLPTELVAEQTLEPAEVAGVAGVTKVILAILLAPELLRIALLTVLLGLQKLPENGLNRSVLLACPAEGTAA